MKRREAKGKEEKERYTQLTANSKEYQGGIKKKNTFLSHQCKEIGENNRMGKTRDVFKKIRDTKGNFDIKDRNGMDLRSRRY